MDEIEPTSNVRTEEQKQDIADEMSIETFIEWFNDWAEGALRLRAVFWRFDNHKVLEMFNKYPMARDNMKIMTAYIESMDRRAEQVMSW